MTRGKLICKCYKNSYNFYQIFEVLIRQWPQTLCYEANIVSCWKYFGFISVWFQKYFCSLMLLCLILLVIGVDLLQFTGIWFIKATTKDSFRLTRTKPHSLQEGIGLIMQTVVSQRWLVKFYNASIFPARSKELHPRYLTFSWLPACSDMSSI